MENRDRGEIIDGDGQVGQYKVRIASEKPHFSQRPIEIMPTTD